MWSQYGADDIFLSFSDDYGYFARPWGAYKGGGLGVKSDVNGDNERQSGRMDIN